MAQFFRIAVGFRPDRSLVLLLCGLLGRVTCGLRHGVEDSAVERRDDLDLGLPRGRGVVVLGLHLFSLEVVRATARRWVAVLSSIIALMV